MDKNTIVKYAGGAVAVIAGVLVIAEAPILCIGAAAGAYVYNNASKKGTSNTLAACIPKIMIISPAILTSALLLSVMDFSVMVIRSPLPAQPYLYLYYRL